VAVEPAMAPALSEGLAALGHEIVPGTNDDSFAFGGAQAVLRIADGYVAGSDPRKDGQAIGG
jgi:gamma-glutamyltranspeptidase / glutathione hydrolase